MQSLKQYSTLTSGTITGNSTKQDEQVIHNAGSLAATLTMAFPSSPTDGQLFGFASVLGVTVLTMTSAATIVGSLASIAAAGCARWMYDSNSSQWIKIG